MSILRFFRLIWLMNEVRTMKTNAQNRGFVLTGALMLLLIGIMVTGSFLFVSRQSHPVVAQWTRYDQTLLAAQTAIEKVKANLYAGFEEQYLQTRSWNDLNWVVANASSYGTSGTLGSILNHGATYAYSNAQIIATVASSDVTGTSPETRVVFVTNTASATFEGITRSIEEVVRYRLHRSSVFDHAYFINNYGWFYNVNCVVNGDIRSNYDMDLRSRYLVLNGYASAFGQVNINRPYQTWSWNTYKRDSYSDFFRPTYYVDQHRKTQNGDDNIDAIFQYGFNRSGTYSHQEKLKMPYLGDLSDYKAYAAQKNGTIRVGSRVLVDHVFSGTGPSGVSGAPDQGSIVLEGTRWNPIVINGPVVVDGDVILKGYFTGQGTIYAGRNVHIIGDVKAVNPPQWEHPDTAANFADNTLPDNMKADFLGLAAKGSIVVGDYRDSGFVRNIAPYIKPPFTKEYKVSKTDSDIGYVSYQKNGTNFFNGDYTATYGEKCGNSTPGNGVPRKFYESSLSDNMFGHYNPATQIHRLDAVIYDNHLTTGRFDSNAMINGAIISRDEGLILDGRTYMNWDSRLALKETFRPFLPLELEPAKTIRWREL